MRKRTVLACTTLALMALWLPAAGRMRTLLVYNPSDSMPHGWYLVEPPRAWRRDDVVVVRLRSTAGAFAVQRGYLPADTPVLKRVGAVATQFVCVRDGLVHIDGVAMASVPARDAAHRPLPAWNQCRALAAGEIFLIGDGHPASFDSRYFGPVDVSDVIGAARPMWTWRGVAQ